jgi:hypothetical protein
MSWTNRPDRTERAGRMPWRNWTNRT